MPPKIKKYAPVILLPLIVILCLWLWSFQRIVAPVPYGTEDGTFDLLDVDFSETVAETSRTVEYVPGVLLTPEEFAQRDDIQVGTIPEGVLVATTRIRLLVPDGIQYGVCGFSVNHASSVYINGKWLFDEGKPAATAGEEKGDEAFHLFSAEPHDGVIEVVVATSSFDHRETAPGMLWLVGEYQNVRTCYVYYMFVVIAIMAWYILLALVFLILFFAQPAHSANGWLVLLALVAALRTGLTSSKPLLTLFPALDWATGYKLELLTVPAALVLLMLVFNSIFPGALPRWLRLVSAAIACVTGASILLLSTWTLSGYGAIFSFACILPMAVAAVFILFHLRRNRLGLPQWIVLSGVGLILFSAVWDTCYYNGILPGRPFPIIQPMLVVFSLFMLVSAMLTTIQKTADAERETAQLRIDMLEKETEMVNARTATMLSQMQDHFLYNTLTAINRLCKGNEPARTAITTFAKYLRGNMDILSQTKPVWFCEELEHIKQYLLLEKLRFEEGLRVEYEIETEDFVLPVLTVQPLVENAVTHGITQKEGGGTVIIRTEETKHTHRIIIKDDGVGFDPAAAPADDGRSHTGIATVRERLAMMCHGSLTLESTPGVGTIAIIEIPRESEVEV